MANSGQDTDYNIAKALPPLGFGQFIGSILGHVSIGFVPGDQSRRASDCVRTEGDRNRHIVARDSGRAITRNEHGLSRHHLRSPC